MGTNDWEILTRVIDWSGRGEGCHSQEGGQDVLEMHGEGRLWCRDDVCRRTASWKKWEWLNDLPRKKIFGHHGESDLYLRGRQNLDE